MRDGQQKGYAGMVESLAAISIFSGLSETEYEKIAAITEKREFEKNTSVFSQTSPGGQLFIVNKGEVKISRLVRGHEEQILAVLKEGEFFGGVSFVDGQAHSASAVCTTETEVFIIDKADFDKLCDEDPALGIRIIKALTLSICNYLRAMNIKFYDMVQYVSLAR